MTKRSFFDRPSGLTIAEIIALTGAEARDGSRLSHLIRDVAPIDHAGPTQDEPSKYGWVHIWTISICRSQLTNPRSGCTLT